jgi:GMP synthase-like glutamine amidotransferase
VNESAPFRALNIHCLQHVPFEGPAGIGDWVAARGHRLTTTHLYRGEKFPDVASVDWIVVMGGPMNIYEHRFHPWLREEKEFIAEAIAQGKTALGVCLGAQLIADVCGARVYQNTEKEIGWLPVSFQGEKVVETLFPDAAREMTVFHWHGDTFDLPPNAVRLASSEGCVNQAFALGDRVVALQFHIETTAQSVAALVEHCGNELTGGRFIQSAAEITGNRAHFAANRQTLEKLLGQLETRTLRSIQR